MISHLLWTPPWIVKEILLSNHCMDLQYGFLAILALQVLEQVWGRVIICWMMVLQATVELCKAHEHGEQPESMPNSLKKHWTHSVRILWLHGPDAISKLFRKHWTFCTFTEDSQYFVLYISKQTADTWLMYTHTNNM